MKNSFSFIVIIILLFQNLYAQENSLLVCGPMLCDVNHREAIIWLEVSAAVTTAQIKCFKKVDASFSKIFSY
ncbi:MAG: hypothetical protein LH473_03285 [Chitinophagales bacterium]|nr:hypothetical protein [Chitinophagales bacterium]